MKRSKTGLWLVAVYVLWATPWLYLGFTATDPKGRFILPLLAEIPALLVVGSTALADVIVGTRVLDNVFFYVPFSALLMYTLGWAIEAAIRSMTKGIPPYQGPTLPDQWSR